MTIPVPQRIDNKLSEFYPLQREELIRLREVKLINNAAYVHLALRYENPFCDRPIQVVPKEFAFRWGMPESSVYGAIAKLKKLGILNIKSGKLVIDWVKPENQDPENQDSEEVVENTAVNDNTPAVGNYQIREKIIRSEKKLSDLRKNYQIRENQALKPLSDKASSIPQTLQKIQTNQTRGLKKTFSEEKKQPTKEVVREVVQKQEIKEVEKLTVSNESLRQTTSDVVQKKTRIISPSKSSSTSNNYKSGEIPDDFKEKLRELNITLDPKVSEAIANHHISQAYGAAAHVENTWDSVSNPRGVFLFQLPRQPVEQLGSRYSEEILNSIKAQNEVIEKERSDPEYYKKSKDVFAQIRAALKQKN